MCIVDDEQWLDSASAQVLAFLARRLEAESVGLVFRARIPTGDLAGLPELVVEGLQEDDARARAGRALAAANTKFPAGAFDAAQDLLAGAEAAAL